MLKDLEVSSRAIDLCFARVLCPAGQSDVEKALRYALTGGKRMRAFLVFESARLFGIGSDVAVWPAAAIEALHAYSLVHDDLPCMDDDDLRRGQPTVHVKWDEATAVLVGDALQSLAFELLTHAEFEAKGAIQAALVAQLAKKAGVSGMVLGQAQDIAAETAKTPLNLAEISALQANKTGALIEWSACAGAVLAEQDTAPLLTYARALGLAFQIHDDILDVEGDAAKTGKAVGKDADAGKATFVSLLGLEAAKNRASALVAEASAALSPYGARAENLRALARFAISRET